MANKSLNAAKAAKEDEFYTQLPDIERELQHYWRHFAGKTVLCNCDDPYESNFFKYFALHFNQLGIKRLICTCYNGSPMMGSEITLDFDDEAGTPQKKAYKVEITEVSDMNGDGAVDLADVRYLLKNDKNVLTELKSGDFRSEECVALLDEADVVVTNPPFSLFREYVAQLVAHDKKFLIVGRQNSCTYKDIFALLMANEMWLGHNAGDMSFVVPDNYAPRKTRFWIDADGVKHRSLGNACWFTNLDHNKRHEEMDLVCRYSPEEYPKYDNYDAIEVGRLANIPVDYAGVMGVPVTIFDKYCPTQFELLGIDRYIEDNPMPNRRFTIKGKEIFARILIRNRHPEVPQQNH